MHRTVYTVEKATFCTEVYGASGHWMDSGCCTYCNQKSINIPTLTRKLSIVVRELISCPHWSMFIIPCLLTLLSSIVTIQLFQWCLCVRACVCVCACACVRACVRACVCE